MRYKLDNITEEGEKCVAYIQVLDIKGKIIATECLYFENSAQFKKELKARVSDLKSKEDRKQKRIVTLEKVLAEIETEDNLKAR